MPSGIYKRTKEHRRKLKETAKRLGLKPPSQKGKKIPNRKMPPFTEERKRKISIIAKKKGFGKWMLGKKLSTETIKKLKETHKAEKHWNWQDGISKKEGYRAFLEKRRNIKKKGNGGFHTFGDWEKLKAQYNWTCPACKKQEPEIKLSEDHIIPLSKGGSNNIENIQPLCISCNSRKNIKIIKYHNE